MKVFFETALPFLITGTFLNDFVVVVVVVALVSAHLVLARIHSILRHLFYPILLYYH